MMRLRTAIGAMVVAWAVLLHVTATAKADTLAVVSDLGADLSASPLTEGELDVLRGGASAKNGPDVVTLQESKLDASVSGNSVGDGSVTGTINFEGSFHDNSGIQSTMINSGNNVSMQSSMTVNLYLN